MDKLTEQLKKMRNIITLTEGRIRLGEDEIKQYLKLNNIPFNKVSYIGSGEYGDAYWLGNNTVLKITTSKSEYDIASEIINKKIPGLVTFYYAKPIGNNFRYAIVMDEVDTDSSIEDMFSRVEMILTTQGLDISQTGSFDEEEYDGSEGELDEETLKFMDDLATIYRSCTQLGIRVPDVNYGNLGYDSTGHLKLFDVQDRAAMRNRMW